MSFGGSQSSNKSSSESSGFGYGIDQSQTYIDPRQQQNQQGLINRFNNQGFQGANQAMQGLQHWRRDTLGDMESAQNRLMPMVGRMQNTARQGANRLAQFSQQNNPYLNSQIHGLAQDFGQMYREQLLPGIGNQAQLAGQRGSSRQGIAEGLAAQRVGQEFGQAAVGLRNQAYSQQQQAASNLAQLGQQGALQGYGMQGQLNSAQGALANTFAQTGLQGAMSPFQIGAQVIGAPSILSQSSGVDYREQQSTSRGSGSSGGFSMGFI